MRPVDAWLLMALVALLLTGFALACNLIYTTIRQLRRDLKQASQDVGEPH